MQYHYVIFFDDEANKWGMDEGTMEARFPDGTIFDTKAEEWIHANESPVADIEDEIYRELVEILAQVNNGELGE